LAHLHATFPYYPIPSLNKFDGEKMSQAPSYLGMLENQLVGGYSSRIKFSNCENPLGTIRHILFESQLAGRQGFQIN
jgi:hypothetical protein